MVTGLRPVRTSLRPATAQSEVNESGPCARREFYMANVESLGQNKLGQNKAAQNSALIAGCWSCGSRRDAHFCASCGKVQPPVPADYFSFFGFSRKLNLDATALSKDFYALSRRLHPDIFGQASDLERAWSLEQSSILNDAYRTLKDPIKRTEYLLRLEGIELEEQSKQATEKARASGQLKMQVVPPDLLEEVFELNMQLEELRAQKQKKMGEDDPALLEEIGQAKRSLEEKHDTLLTELKNDWNQWDALIDSENNNINNNEAGRRKVLDRMLDVLNRRNYIRNLLRDVNEAMEG